MVHCFVSNYCHFVGSVFLKLNINFRLIVVLAILLSDHSSEVLSIVFVSGRSLTDCCDVIYCEGVKQQ